MPDVKLPMPRLQKQRFLQVFLNNVNLSLIIDVLQQLISILGYQNPSTCCNKPQCVSVLNAASINSQIRTKNSRRSQKVFYKVKRCGEMSEMNR